MLYAVVQAIVDDPEDAPDLYGDLAREVFLEGILVTKSASERESLFGQVAVQRKQQGTRRAGVSRLPMNLATSLICIMKKAIYKYGDWDWERLTSVYHLDDENRSDH